jgi:hypothetical protein
MDISFSNWILSIFDTEHPIKTKSTHHHHGLSQIPSFSHHHRADSGGRGSWTMHLSQSTLPELLMAKPWSSLWLTVLCTSATLMSAKSTWQSHTLRPRTKVETLSGIYVVTIAGSGLRRLFQDVKHQWTMQHRIRS